jgi:uncharacterized lipoprotein YajG
MRSVALMAAVLMLTACSKKEEAAPAAAPPAAAPADTGMAGMKMDTAMKADTGTKKNP